MLSMKCLINVYNTATLMMSFFVNPSPISGAWPSSGENIINSPGCIVIIAVGLSEKNAISLLSLYAVSGEESVAKDFQPNVSFLVMGICMHITVYLQYQSIRWKTIPSWFA
jgi:hypothetical protein